MTTVACNDCGRAVSIDAATCPHCGAPNPADGPVARAFGFVGKLISSLPLLAFIAFCAWFVWALNAT